MQTLIRVRSNGNAADISGAIAGLLRENGEVLVQSIGLSASNVALKAIIKATDYLMQEGKTVNMRAAYITVPSDLTGEVTAIRFQIFAA